MKTFLAKLDLYKVIILLCLLAMPVLGYSIWSMQEKLRVGQTALAQATMQGRGNQTGDIEAIGTLMAQIDKVKDNKVDAAGGDSHRVAFQRAIQGTNASGLKLDDFAIGDIKTTTVNIDRNKQAIQ